MAPRFSPGFTRTAFFFAWMVAATIGIEQAWSQNTKKEVKIPERERVTVTTKDGVQLSCFYYKGGFAQMGEDITEVDGKQVVPVIMIHGWGGRASDFDGFASLLQSGGYAVMVPDLRGHGQSTILKTGEEIIPSKMNKKTAAAAMLLDIEAVKGYLLEKNNAGEVNINMLALVGAGEGATLVMNWAIQDWSRRQLPAFRQGRDAKLLVLLSPPATFGGLKSLPAATSALSGNMRYMIGVGGRDVVAFKDADKIRKALERTHAQNPEETVQFVEADVELQGAALLKDDLPDRIDLAAARFLHTSLFERSASFPWEDRPDPLGRGD